MDPDFDAKKINEIIEKRLSRISPSLKQHFPAILQKEKISWATISEIEYLTIVFLTSEDENRINDYISKRLNPFPGLITTRKESAAFRVEKARYMLLNSCSVNNSYTFSLGNDSTIILENHTQSLDTQKFGTIQYRVPLAYIISYGDEINKATVYEYFEGLVAYSTNMWREADAK